MVVHEPFEDEIVGETETFGHVVVVERGIPERVADRIVVRPVFRIVEVFVYASVLVVFLVIGIGIGVFLE